MIIVLKGADFSRNNIGQISAPNIKDEDVENYISKMLATNPDFNVDFYKTPLIKMVDQLKEFGLYEKFYYLNLLLGTTANSQRIPIIDTNNKGTYYYEGDLYKPTFSQKGFKLNNKNGNGVLYSNCSFMSVPYPSEINATGGEFTVTIGRNKMLNQILAGDYPGKSISVSADITYGWSSIGSTYNNINIGKVIDDTKALVSLTHHDGKTSMYLGGLKTVEVEEPSIIYDDNNVFTLHSFGDRLLFKNSSELSDTIKVKPLGSQNNSTSDKFTNFVSISSPMDSEELSKLQEIVKAFQEKTGRYS